jgi:hypothetical protein
MKGSKNDIITFKVDETLRSAMRGIPNRSEFIRAAILAALDSVCPLCDGTGILTPNQRDHWNTFAGTHQLEECGHCHERTLVCLNSIQPAQGMAGAAKGVPGRRR